MSPDHNKPAAAKPVGKDESQSSTSRKPSSARPQEPPLKCPRCDSPNTKFCYYNNYSLTQPRHFCKTCRRYWTKGGALRNVPIGGGCRKNKKMKASPRLSGDSKDSSGSSEIGGLKFFQGISPAMDSQQLNFPRLHHHSSSPHTALFNQFSNLGDLSNTSTAIAYNFDPSATNSSPLMGFNFPFSSTIKHGETNNNPGFQEMGSLNLHSSLASSIESLSSINQDLHWKLQKQRLAMVFDNHKDNNNNNNSLQSIEPINVQKPQPILFQNLEISKPESCGIKPPRKDGGLGNLSTEWFFDNAYATVNPTPATSGSNVNENSSSWSGIQAWNDLSQYTSSLP